jgi:menaquinone-dependent protoporphyrinogen oxidase
MRVLVAYSSKHGATAEIADAIAAQLRADGLEADAVEAGAVRDLDGVDAVVLGSAVYMKRWQHGARRFLHRHAAALAAVPFWVFSSGPVGEDADPTWSEPATTIEAAEKLGARGHVVFGGRLSETGGFVERSMARNTPEERRDLRDWDEIRVWASRIAAELSRPAARAMPR